MEGTLLARASSQARLIIAPPRSITFIRGGTRLIVQAARGMHTTQILSWPGALTPLLESWIAGRAGARASHSHKGVACKPIDPHFRDAIARFDKGKNSTLEATEPLLLSVAYEVVTHVMLGFDEFQLAAIPVGLPETVEFLTEEVRSNPAGAWPLKEAADRAGYSPFHFSRVFKQMVGYGFHEFVDRCRTECAVNMLCETDSAVDLVASTCGFGTTQGLRESVKEYLGLVPSEIRAFPESLDLLTEV
jgi:AraC-like DNA-binding protein